MPPQRECKKGELRLRCTNDHCQEAHEQRIEERRGRKPRREGDRGLVASQDGEQDGGGSAVYTAAVHPGRELAEDELRRKQAKLKPTQAVVEPDSEGGSQGGIYSMHDIAFAVGLVGLVGLLAREILERFTELKRALCLRTHIRRAVW